jgi:LuxR family maltose regulon positive regulatory protein
VLTRLARTNLPIVALDRVDERYRYNTLFAETLRIELARSEPGEARQLHRRASDWYVGREDAERAIEHAVAADDQELAGELLWRSALRIAPDRKGGRVGGWLAHFGDERAMRVPGLALARAASHLARGDAGALGHWTDVAASAPDSSRRSARGRSLAARVTVMRAAAADGLDVMRGEAARAYRLEDGHSPWRSACRLLEGTAVQLGGDPATARPLLEEGARLGAVAAPLAQTLCLAQLALLSLDEGEVDAAGALAERAATQAVRTGLEDVPIQAAVFAVSALLRARRGLVEDAAADLRHARLLLDATDFAPWYDVQTRVVLAGAALRLGQVTTARTLLCEAGKGMRELRDAPVLASWHEGTRAKLDAAVELSAVEEWSLTPAELRVLQFLPSHLSLPEIGQELFVSPNTVKAHVRAVYRKLDASCRAEAVTRARDGGLLEASPQG